MADLAGTPAITPSEHVVISPGPFPQPEVLITPAISPASNAPNTQEVNSEWEDNIGRRNAVEALAAFKAFLEAGAHGIPATLIWGGDIRCVIASPSPASCDDEGQPVRPVARVSAFKRLTR